MVSYSLCPVCSSSLTRVGAFLIFPEHGQVELGKKTEPLRIFLSYGHDANEELVSMIKADLEKRGHDVWFDKNENKFGVYNRHNKSNGLIFRTEIL
jgi:hypothetical protein